MKALVYIETRDGVLNEDALGLLSYVSACCNDVAAVLCTTNADQHVTRIAQCGASRILVGAAPAVADPLPQAHADLLANLCHAQGFDTVLFASTVLSADIAAVLAARLEAGVLWGLVSVTERDGQLIGQRMALRDTVLAEVAWTTPLRVALFRPRQFEPVEKPAAAVPVETVAVAAEVHATRTRMVESTASVRQGVSLTQAEIIVSGGRGLGKQENLQLVRDLAAALGGMAGVSLPLVDMGWAPREMQVGQTGTVVKPQLYIACGISGQIQHKLGMEQAGTIVAINTDRDAPIMQFCDMAVVADATQVLPALTALLKERVGT